MLENNQIKFDFLGKDSIRYENIVDVKPEVWKNMKAFKLSDCNGKKKQPDDQLFDAMNAQVSQSFSCEPCCELWSVSHNVFGLCDDRIWLLLKCGVCRILMSR
jgi:hypothetical protein